MIAQKTRKSKTDYTIKNSIQSINNSWYGGFSVPGGSTFGSIKFVCIPEVSALLGMSSRKHSPMALRFFGALVKT